MSTKIYDGFVINLPVEKALALLGRQRAAVQALVDLKTHRLVAQRITTLIDQWCDVRAAGGPHRQHLEAVKAEAALWTCGGQVADEQAACRKSMRRNPEVDCDALLRLFLDTKKHRIVGFPFEERLGLNELLRALPEVADFAYWNNTDPPTEVSKKDWRDREQTWNRIFKDEGRCELSMSWEALVTFDPSEIAPQLPSFEDRVRTRADDMALNHYVRQHWTPPAGGSTTGLFRAVTAARDALKDPASELSAHRAEYETHLRAALLPDLAPHLMTPLMDLP